MCARSCDQASASPSKGIAADTKEANVPSTYTVRYQWEKIVRSIRTYDYQGMAINLAVLIVMFVLVAIASHLFLRA